MNSAANSTTTDTVNSAHTSQAAAVSTPKTAVSVKAVLPTTHDVWHAVIGLVDAATEENVIDAAVGLTVTAAVAVTPVAEMVLAWATVELSFAAKTPLPFVEPVAEGLKALDEPLALSVTEAPLIRLLN